ncbi:asparagine synthase [Virgisporangium aliadipatigenens]|uniref:asparagine synthase (glutamine-hydrolyzing) n=1 Tax=Virgisporangium aliadipatigenens TaxID=741659 RepID=A0A8J3YJV6_9ACTN|nr:asparagine synthase-related protein [Virgisporangium aliadipatigenens]GIJ46754.1 asparagine synthase [Virgisporangium aliadipatigenens]
MTAVAGLVRTDGAPVRAAELRPVLDLLAPLGGDGEGTWAGPVGATAVALGATRRRRVPEDDGDDQPVCASVGDVVVVADAVLTNRPALCRALGLPDDRNLADAHLVLHAYLRWGDRCWQRLRGGFAGAIADRRRGGVLVARDHLGTRPLHVYRDGGRVCFASTAVAVTGFDGVPVAPDLERAKEFLGLVASTRRSWFRDVSPVPRATALWITPDGVRERTYWTFEHRPVRHGSAAEHAEELRDALDEAVRARVRRRRGPVGVLLSGGLDSTSVAATAAGALAPEPVRSYTSVPPPGWSGPAFGFEPDESGLVRVLAARYPNLVPAFVDGRGEAVVDGDPDRFAAGASPVRNTLNMTWLRVAERRAADDGVSLLLTGALGNIAFSADDPRWLVALLGAGRPVEAWREARAWAAARDGSLARLLRTNVVPQLVPQPLRRLVSAARGRPDLITRTLARSGLRPDIVADPRLHRALRGQFPGTAGHHPRRYPTFELDAVASAAENIAVREARGGWWQSDPTVDVELLTACARQPAWARRHRGIGRSALRMAMAGRLPDEIRLRKARGAQVPDWFDRIADAHAELAAELARARGHPTTAALVDLDRIARLVREPPAPERAADAACRDAHAFLLPRVLALSRYLRWFDGYATRRTAARRPAALAGPH